MNKIINIILKDYNELIFNQKNIYLKTLNGIFNLGSNELKIQIKDDGIIFISNNAHIHLNNLISININNSLSFLSYDTNNQLLTTLVICSTDNINFLYTNNLFVFEISFVEYSNIRDNLIQQALISENDISIYKIKFPANLLLTYNNYNLALRNKFISIHFIFNDAEKIKNKITSIYINNFTSIYSYIYYKLFRY